MIRATVKFGWLILGFAALGLGIIGAVLPLLPTTPFILLAAFCFARSSPRFHAWLVNHRLFGPLIMNWQDKGAISKKAKIAAMVAIVLAFALAYLFGAPMRAMMLQAVVLICVSVFILTRPSA